MFWNRHKLWKTSEKQVVIILGYESSGSTFLAQVVSYVLGKCPAFGVWRGRELNGTVGDPLLVLQRSVPHMRPKLWNDSLSELCAPFPGYAVKIIICTRDLNISQESRVQRFGGSSEVYQEDSRRASRFFSKILLEEDAFIFSYETAVALKYAYYRVLYQWLGIDSKFEPEIRDENRKYLHLPGQLPISEM